MLALVRTVILISSCEANIGEMAELAEGAPLLREYGAKSFIEGSNPSLSASMAPPMLG